MLISYIRTIFLYLLLLTVLRLMGKRQLGEMEPAEFVVAMLIADLAAIPMQGTEIPLLAGVVPILTVLGIQLLLSVASMKWVGFRRLLCGKPVILIGEGKIQRENLRRARITLDELGEQLREKNVLDMGQVQYAILETNGQLSVFPFPQHQPPSAKDLGCQATPQYIPITLISDGKLLEHNLQLSGKSRAWVEHTLRGKGCKITDTLLFTVDKAGNIHLVKKEEQA